MNKSITLKGREIEYELVRKNVRNVNYRANRVAWASSNALLRYDQPCPQVTGVIFDCHISSALLLKPSAGSKKEHDK